MSGTADLQDNLVDDLLEVVDDLRRDLYSSMGNRQHEVHLVRRAWSGEARGEGVIEHVEDHIIDPPPLFVDKTKLVAMSFGRDDQGDGLLQEVSLTYTEDELTGNPIKKNEEFFYRVVDLRGQGIRPTHYVPNSTPVPDREKKIGWAVFLRRAEVKE